MSSFYKQIKTIAIVGALTACLSTSALAAPGGQAIAAGCTTGSDLNLRTSASTSASVITMLNKGVAVAILDTSNPDWYQISYNGNTGYVSTQYMLVDQDGLFTTYGKVCADAVAVRSEANEGAEVLATVDTGAGVTVNGIVDGWYMVTCTYGTQGFIRSDYIDLQATNPDPAISISASSVLETAAQYLGTRYRYGGTSSSGFDCSGFTMTVYSNYDVSLPHTASGQWSSGVGDKVYSVSALSAGDLVFFRDPSVAGSAACSHVGIYVGDGQFIHSSSSYGVSYATLLSGYWGSYFIGGLSM